MAEDTKAAEPTAVATTPEPAPAPKTLTPAQILFRSIGKMVIIDNCVDKPFEDILEYVGASDVIVKHGSRYPFWQVKGA